LKILIVLGGLAIVAGLAFLYGLFVMLLWNWLMPDIFGLPKIDYWHAWGLVLLSHILLKSWGGRHWRRRGYRRHGRFGQDSGGRGEVPDAAPRKEA
jgi:hypothetical protein